MDSEFASGHVTGRRSNVGNLIKTKSGKMFLQHLNKGKNSMKKDRSQNDYQRQETGHGFDEAPQVDTWSKKRGTE